MVAIADSLLPFARASRPLSGILDESAHLATGLVAVRALGGGGGPFSRGLIAGSVLLDADHVPDALGHTWLRSGTKRPYPHALITPALVAALARRARGRARPWTLGVAAGITLHLVRDLATGQGAMLLWPGSVRNFRLGYPAYVALLAVLVAAPRPASPRGRPAARGVRASRGGGSRRSSSPG